MDGGTHRTSALSRRLLLKRTLQAGAYSAPVIVAHALPVGVAAATPPPVTAAPTITAISPTSGPATGGTTVTITGTNFVSASLASANKGVRTAATGTSVSIGGNPCGNVQVGSGGTSLTCTTPAGNAGPVDVTVTTPNGSATRPGFFIFQALTNVTDIAIDLSPKNQTVARGGPFSVTVTATNNGPLAATGIEVIGSLASGLMDNLVATPSVGTYTGKFNSTNDDDFIWRIPSLAVGATARLVVNGILRSNALTGFPFGQLAMLQLSTPSDPFVSNNTSQTTFTAT
jgi:hypothetical protein